MEVELMVTKRDDNRRRPTDRVNIEQSASGRWTGRVLQKDGKKCGRNFTLGDQAKTLLRKSVAAKIVLF